MNIAVLELLLLILVANGSPILTRNLCVNKCAYAVDAGANFFDKNRLLGDSKTWRGVIASITITIPVAIILGYHWTVGASVASLAMSGDLISSFIKRRLNMPPSSMAPVLDQVPESLLPAFFMMQVFGLSMIDLLIVVPSFVVLEILLSRILYKLGVRKHPY